jgi:NAD(P)-dependent dehydrogenase (short-subunit alcohol dehydrogenase family)
MSAMTGGADSSDRSPSPGLVWFITGATSGIGRELALAALRRRDRVAAAARRTYPIAQLAEEYGARVLAIEVDVRDETAIDQAVRRTVQTLGRIDVVANNAGYGLFGAVEEATDAQARAIFDTNVFGVLNVLRAALPVLRDQGSGHILQGSSFYGQSAHAGVGLLASTKYAVEGLSDALIDEVKPLGIDVTIVEPGPTATSFLDNLDLTAPTPAYDGTVRAVQQAIAALPPDAFTDPARVATAILAIVDADDPPLRFAIGTGGADDMRAALTARLTELDNWSAVTDSVAV